MHHSHAEVEVGERKVAADGGDDVAVVQEEERSHRRKVLEEEVHRIHQREEVEGRQVVRIRRSHLEAWEVVLRNLVEEEVLRSLEGVGMDFAAKTWLLLCL